MDIDRQVVSSGRAEADLTSMVKRFDRPERVFALEKGWAVALTALAAALGA